ncbi:MAG: hypothetical protein HeimC2_32020 [Candidatus Heimdallarchaeota archaeon LC_2]|nr:MAG: hypothetical protein HeimC2_32020 [Candidatus Heimdallarchaeota archaeon LC_2]
MMMQEIPPIFLDDALTFIEILPDRYEKIICVTRYGSKEGEYRIFFEGEKHYDFSLPKIVMKCYSSFSQSGDKSYGLAIDRSEFANLFMKYFNEIHNTIMQIKEIDSFAIFGRDPKRAYKKGFYLGLKLVPTQVEVESAMGEYLTDEKERLRFTRRMMGIFKFLYPATLIYRDMIAKWNIFSTRGNDNLLMDRKFFGENGVDADIESLIFLYLEYLSLREFSTRIRGGFLEIKKLNISESPFLLEFTGSGITELSMTEEGLKSLLITYYEQFDIPSHLQPSLSGKFHVSRLSCDSFLVCNDNGKAINRLKQKIQWFSNSIKDGAFDVKMAELVVNPILHTMDLRQHITVDLHITYFE